MTSPLVKPAAGYSTLSRLDSSSVTPSTLTDRRSFIDALRCRLVGTQALQPGEAQPAVRGLLAVPDLDHHLGPYPGGVLAVLAGQFAGERRGVGDQRSQRGKQFALLGRR